MSREEEHLNLLGIFHYVLGGIIILTACIPLLHFLIGAGLIVGAFASEEIFLALPGVVFMAIAGLVILSGWALGILTIISGYKLNHRRSYTFCLVIAGFVCIYFPLGTVLGVFTIVTLAKDPVRELFYH